MDTRLLVSLSGVDHRTPHRVADVISELDGREVPLTWLVRPRTVEGAPLLIEWVKARAARGDGVLLHGFDHTVTPSHRPWWPGRLGSCDGSALPAHEAGLRLTAAVAALERIGLRVDGFAPPRWLGSAGTLTALRRHGFELCADASGVHDPRTGDVRRARVHSLPRGSARSEQLRCLALVQGVARAARRGGLVRLDMDVADLVHPGPRAALLDAVDAALDAGARADTYGASRAVGAR